MGGPEKALSDPGAAFGSQAAITRVSAPTRNLATRQYRRRRATRHRVLVRKRIDRIARPGRQPLNDEACLDGDVGVSLSDTGGLLERVCELQELQLLAEAADDLDPHR